MCRCAGGRADPEAARATRRTTRALAGTGGTWPPGAEDELDPLVVGRAVGPDLGQARPAELETHERGERWILSTSTRSITQDAAATVVVMKLG